MARYLHERGVDAFGLDLSAGMVAQARSLNPGIQFRQGDLLSLADDDNSWAGAAAFYSLIHLPQERLLDALSGLYRVLEPGGALLIVFHVGSEVRHLDALWEVAVSLDFVFFEVRGVVESLTATGFTVEEIVERSPYPDVEAQTQRCYILASKPEQE